MVRRSPPGFAGISNKFPYENDHLLISQATMKRTGGNQLFKHGQA